MANVLLARSNVSQAIIHQFNRARATFDRLSSPGLFSIATTGYSSATRIALRNDAMALCGSPVHKMSRRRWSDDAHVYLAAFCVPYLPLGPGGHVSMKE